MKEFLVVALCLCLHDFVSAFEDKSIEQWLIDNNYQTFAYAINFTGLTQELTSQGPYTVFLPSDIVFMKLGSTELQSLLSEPKKINYIVKYHVISKFVLSATINGPTTETTLNGESLLIQPTSSGLLINNKTHVLPWGSDIVCNNGIIHLIDSVLEAPSLPNITLTNILLTHDNEFRDMFLALLLTNFTHLLDGGEYTLFAPTDAAFAEYKETLLHPSGPNLGKIYDEVIRYHIVPGTRLSSDLTDGQKLFTLQGTALNITVNSAGVRINEANVVDADLQGGNGVVHGIDHLLIPDSLKAFASHNDKK